MRRLQGQGQDYEILGALLQWNNDMRASSKKQAPKRMLSFILSAKAGVMSTGAVCLNFSTSYAQSFISVSFIWPTASFVRNPRASQSYYTMKATETLTVSKFQTVKTHVVLCAPWRIGGCVTRQDVQWHAFRCTLGTENFQPSSAAMMNNFQLITMHLFFKIYALQCKVRAQGM